MAWWYVDKTSKTALKRVSFEIVLNVSDWAKVWTSFVPPNVQSDFTSTGLNLLYSIRRVTNMLHLTLFLSSALISWPNQIILQIIYCRDNNFCPDWMTKMSGVFSRLYNEEISKRRKLKERINSPSDVVSYHNEGYREE